MLIVKKLVLLDNEWSRVNPIWCHRPERDGSLLFPINETNQNATKEVFTLITALTFCNILVVCLTSQTFFVYQ